MIGYSFLNKFKLSKGWNRIFGVFSVILFFFVLHVSWKDVDLAKRKRSLEANERQNVIITAISTGRVGMGRGIEKYETYPPRAIAAAYGGRVLLLCLLTHSEHKFERQTEYPIDGSFYSADPNVFVFNSNMSLKQLDAFLDGKEFRDCVSKKINENDSRVRMSIIKAITLPFLSVILAYLCLMILVALIRWIIEGFKNN